VSRARLAAVGLLILLYVTSPLRGECRRVGLAALRLREATKRRDSQGGARRQCGDVCFCRRMHCEPEVDLHDQVRCSS
jgi:hypothetical protein